MKKSGKIKKNKGMILVELIVTLGIFTIISFISVFNYGAFQAKVDIKNLASDIAIKIVEAQKSSLFGKWNSGASGNWKPSYGVYFSTTTSTKFIYFADLNNLNGCDSANCNPPSYSIGGEVLDIINITKGNTVSELTVGGGTACPTITNLTIIFKRPDSSAKITSSVSGLSTCNFSYVQAKITSPKGAIAYIKIYPSGRIQVN